MLEEIIAKARTGDSEAFAELSRSYTPLIESMTEKYAVLTEGFGADKDDVRQEVSLAFYKATMTFDSEQSEVSFGLYAKICIRNRLVSMLRSLRKKRVKPLKDNDGDSKRQSASLELRELMKNAPSLLSKRESTVFSMYVSGFSYADIAQKLMISEKSVDNALFRAKKKLRINYGEK